MTREGAIDKYKTGEITWYKLWKLYGDIDKHAFHVRLKKGASPEEALMPAQRKEYQFKGEKLTLTEISMKTGVSASTLWGRINNYKMSAEEAARPFKKKDKYDNCGGYPGTCHNGKLKHLHIIAAEKALGRPLPKGAEVHHVDGNKENHDNTNLVIAENKSYHLLLHRRTNSLRATGDPNFRRCQFCKGWSDPRTDSIHVNTRDRSYHKECLRLDNKKRKAAYKNKAKGTK
jgi:hypothetical protein